MLKGMNCLKSMATKSSVMSNKSQQYFEILDLPNFKDSRGDLTVLEKVLPFEVERIYWICNASEKRRGGHRHKKTYQAAIAVRGTVNIFMSDGKREEEIRLNSPSKVLIIRPEDWHTMEFRDDAILLVLASHVFDKKDYIDTPYR